MIRTRSSKGVTELVGADETAFLLANRPSVEKLMDRLLESLSSARNERYYIPHPVLDIDGNAANIQFRNELDAQNILAVTVAADMRGRGNPASEVKFRTEDNQTRVFNAVSFANYSEELFTAKQAILHKYWEKKDALLAMALTEANRAAIESYDPTAGW